MRLAAAFIGVSLATATVVAPLTPVDPFAFLRPVVVVTEDDRARLDRGEVVVRVLPGRDRELAVFASLRVGLDGERLISWVREIAEFKKSTLVKAIHRFSDPAVLEDLADLALDDADLDAIRQCRPGDCALKLSASEMAGLQAGALGRTAWKPAIQDAFRQMVVSRVRAYREGGLAALPNYQDHTKDGLARRPVFAGILQRSTYVTERMPGFGQWLDGYPAPPDGVESFAYWSQEQFGGRPVVSATHVGIVRNTEDRELPEVVVAGKQIFATHYMNGSLNLTMMLRGARGEHYLTYVNRSEIDLLGGLWGGVRRSVIERHIKSETAELLQGLRRRLEGGEPGR